MSSPQTQSPNCRVVGGSRLPTASGGPAALCSAIERAVAARVAGARFKAEVRVLSSSRLSATIVADGHALPEQNFASMDKDVDRHSFERFAEALADQVAKAMGRE